MCAFLCRTDPSLLELRNTRQHFTYLGAIFNSNIPNKKDKNVNNVALSRPQKGHLFIVSELKQEGRVSVTLFELSWESTH